MSHRQENDERQPLKPGRRSSALVVGGEGYEGEKEDQGKSDFVACFGHCECVLLYDSAGISFKSGRWRQVLGENQKG